MNKIRLAIVEDIDDIRIRMTNFFAQQEETECVLSAASMESFFDQMEDVARVDVVLTDIGLPGMDGIEGMKRMKKQWPGTEIVMLTIFKDDDKIFKSVCAGASGYILKDTPLPEIKKAVIETSKGGSYMSPSIARKVMAYFAPEKANINEPLTPKEKQIIMALTEGLSYRLIGEKLLISIDTVRFHIRNIYKKLEVNTRLEVINKVHRGEL